MPEIWIHQRSELQQWARQNVGLLKRPCVVLLQGNLGAGKTQLVRWFVEALGAADASSPTFAIHQEYQGNDGPIDHVDLYRVLSDADLEASGFWDLLSNEQGLLFVEWAERLPDEIWPAHWTQVYIQLEKVEGEEEGRRVSWRISRP